MREKITRKKILSFIIAAAILAGAATSLNSCDKPEVFNLIEMLFDNRQDNESYKFNAELNIKINKDYLYESSILTDLENAELEAVPDEINFKLDGDLLHTAGMRACGAFINLSLADYRLQIFITDDILYFENNETTKIILDLLTAAGFVDSPVNRIFGELAYAQSGLFYIDLKDFDLSWFEQFAEQINKTFRITSKFDIKSNDMPAEMPPPDFAAHIIYFDEIKARTEQRLLSVPGYRYSELDIIISPDNYMHVLAVREDDTRELLEPFKLDTDASMIEKISETSGALLTENIIPMRYILELMGEEVGWDNDERKPFIMRGGEPVYFDAVLRNSRAYISLIQIITPGQYDLSTKDADEYLEFKIFRKD